MIAMARALAHLVVLSFKRQIRSKKVIICLSVLLMLVVLVAVVGTVRVWSVRSFSNHVVLRMIGLFYLPIVALVFGTGALGDDREEGTLPYLFSRPLPRWGIFVGKFLAVLPVALAFTVGGLWILHQIARTGGAPGFAGSFGVFFLPVLLGTLAYLGLFHLLGAVFRHSTLIAIAYVFFIEVFLGRIPGILKRVSVSFYTWSMVYDAGASEGISVPSRTVFLPVSWDVASRVLTITCCACILLGALYFSRREYSAKS